MDQIGGNEDSLEAQAVGEEAGWLGEVEESKDAEHQGVPDDSRCRHANDKWLG